MELEKERGVLSSTGGRATLVPGKEKKGLGLRNMATVDNEMLA